MEVVKQVVPYVTVLLLLNQNIGTAGVTVHGTMFHPVSVGSGYIDVFHDDTIIQSNAGMDLVACTLLCSQTPSCTAFHVQVTPNVRCDLKAFTPIEAKWFVSNTGSQIYTHSKKIISYAHPVNIDSL